MEDQTTTQQEDQTMTQQEDQTTTQQEDQTMTQQEEQQQSESTPTTNDAVDEELEMYWKPVRERPDDFDSWTYLLQCVDKKDDFTVIADVYNAFFKLYPYCYGYWKKYAEGAIKCSDAYHVLQIYEAGVQAIPLSIDLWEAYLTFYTKSLENDEEDRTNDIRGLYQRAVSTAGMEFVSDVLWNSYLDWEKTSGSLKFVLCIYDQVLRIPTRQYGSYLVSLTEFVNSNEPETILSEEELARAQSEIAASSDEGNESVTTESIRAWILKSRQEIYNTNEEEVKKRWAFEDGIHRPYFHVKPLEPDQLKNWRDYLDFEIMLGDQNRIRVLFERCLIACAMYEEFWLKYARYIEGINLQDAIPIYERACNIHVRRKYAIHIAWSTAAEKLQNYERADSVLENFLINVPGLIVVIMHRINLARRRKDCDKVERLFYEAISNATSTKTRSFYASRFSKYLLQVKGDVGEARRILMEEIEKCKESEMLYWELLNLELSQPGNVNKAYVEALFGMVSENEKLSGTCKEEFSRMQLDFLEDFETDIDKIKEAYAKYEKTFSVTLPKFTEPQKRSLEEPIESQNKLFKADGSTDTQNVISNPVTPNMMGAQDPAMYYQQSWAAYGQGGGYGYPQPNMWGAGYSNFPAQS